jgi:hypothetical protein
MEMPETRYARSGDVNIAYQVFGDGEVDLVWIPGVLGDRPNQVERLRADQAGEFTPDRVREVIAEELPEGGRFAEAREIFERVALGDDFVEFLTLPAYDYID